MLFKFKPYTRMIRLNSHHFKFECTFFENRDCRVAASLISYFECTQRFKNESFIGCMQYQQQQIAFEIHIHKHTHSKHREPHVCACFLGANQIWIRRTAFFGMRQMQCNWWCVVFFFLCVYVYLINLHIFIRNVNTHHPCSSIDSKINLNHYFEPPEDWKRQNSIAAVLKFRLLRFRFRSSTSS